MPKMAKAYTASFELNCRGPVRNKETPKAWLPRGFVNKAG